MKAFEIRGNFGLDCLNLVERPEPVPGPGQVVLKMRAHHSGLRTFQCEYRGSVRQQVRARRPTWGLEQDRGLPVPRRVNYAPRRLDRAFADDRAPESHNRRPDSRIPALWITKWLRGSDLN